MPTEPKPIAFFDTALKRHMLNLAANAAITIILGLAALLLNHYVGTTEPSQQIQVEAGE